MDPPESRPLEGLEALFACFHERLGDLTTCSATRIDGLSKLPTNDIEARAKAVIKSLVISHPLLRSTVRLDDAGKRHLAALDDESLWPELQIEYEQSDVTRPVETVENEEETGWQYSLRREHDHRFVHNEALVKFLLHFPADGNDSVYLILSAHHGLFDGRSLVVLAKDVVAAIRRSIAQGLAEHSCDSERIPPSLQRSSSLRNLMGESFPKSSGMDNSAGFPDANKTYAFDHHTKLTTPSEVRYLYRKLSDGTVKKLVAQCRCDGVRLTSTIIAAFTGQGLHCHLQRPEVTDSVGFQCCVDLRRYIDNDERDSTQLLGNLYSIADLTVPVLPDDYPENDYGSRETLVKRSHAIQKELEEQLTDRRFLAGAHAACVDELANGADNLCNKVEVEGYHGRDFYSGVSNLGKIDINNGVEEAAEVSAQAIVATEYWFMTRLARVGTFCFFSCNYIPDHGMCIVFTRPHPICSLESAKGIMERTISALEAYAGVLNK